jgi:hypothetical protein
MLALQQAQLEEEQAVVARQRIELEQFQTSLRELEQMLERKADQLQPIAAKQETLDSTHDDSSHSSYSGEPERESHPSLSESEAFAAMADQVAALYRTPSPRKTGKPIAPSAAGDADGHDPYAKQGDISMPAEFSTPVADEHTQGESESLIISSSNIPEPEAEVRSSSADTSAPLPPILAPMCSEDFESQLDERVARVMGKESVSWSSCLSGPAATSDAVATPENQPSVQAPDQPTGEPLTQSDAVSNVLDRLREAGLWRGEGTAKADQFPSSTPPLDEEGVALCRSSELGPIGADNVEPESLPQELETTPEAQTIPNPLAQPQTASPSLLRAEVREETEADDSIENYMSRLMQRLRTTDSEPAPQDIRKSSSRGATSAQSRTTSAPAEPPPPPKPVDNTPITCLSELAPRTQAPEGGANLAAMRELANSAARGAIEFHQQHSGKKRITIRTMNVLLGILVAAGCVFWWSRTGSWLAMGGAGICLLYALGFSLLAALQGLSLRKANGKEEQASTTQ